MQRRVFHAPKLVEETTLAKLTLYFGTSTASTCGSNCNNQQNGNNP